MKYGIKHFAGICVACLITNACAQPIEKVIQPQFAQNANVALDGTKSVLPSCTEAQERYRELAGELPKNYPALHFDKEELIRTMVGVANNPKIDLNELARIFGLRFVACSRPDLVQEGQAPTFSIERFSDAGFPLKSIGGRYEASAAFFDFLGNQNSGNGTALLQMFFDFTKANKESKLDLTNCVVEKDFEAYFEKDWRLSVYYGHVGWKYYQKTIDKYAVEFGSRPFMNPDYKPPSTLPWPVIPVCITSISILIKPVQ